MYFEEKGLIGFSGTIVRDRRLCIVLAVSCCKIPLLRKPKGSDLI